jgi:hypothetical protein
MATPGRTAWLAGLVLGVPAAFLVLVFPLVGVLILLAAVALLLLRGPRRFGIGGLLIGFGSTWTALLLLARLNCDAFNAAPNQGCTEPPTIDTYLVAGVILAMLGLALTLVAVRERRAY